MTSSEDAIRSVEKTLGEPVFIIFSDEVLRLRRNLIIFSVITLTYKLTGVEIKSFNPFGINFTGFSPELIDQVFFFFILYSLIHFFWQSVDALQEWRIRITGTRLGFITAARMSSENGDYPNDARQSSLMNWWVNEAKKIGSLSLLGDRISSVIEHFHAKVNEIGNPEELRALVTHHQSELYGLKGDIERIGKMTDSARIPVSLARFEKWFKMFSYSQLARFAIMEWGLPVFLSLWALCLVWPWKIFNF